MFPKTLLIIDLETTGLNPKKDHVIELGAILYSVRNHCILQQFSTLFPVQSNSAESINRISAGASQSINKVALMIELFKDLVEQADYLVAHNARFDKQWFGNSILPEINKPWLCTYEDFLWDKNKNPSSLIDTSSNYGIIVSGAHRALTDCQLIASLFDSIFTSKGNLESFVQSAVIRANEDVIKISALVNYENRQQAKDFNFKWDGKNRQWYKVLKASDFCKEKDIYPFQILILEITLINNLITIITSIGYGHRRIVQGEGFGCIGENLWSKTLSASDFFQEINTYCFDVSISHVTSRKSTHIRNITSEIYKNFISYWMLYEANKNKHKSHRYYDSFEDQENNEYYDEEYIEAYYENPELYYDKSIDNGYLDDISRDEYY